VSTRLGVALAGVRSADGLVLDVQLKAAAIDKVRTGVNISPPSPR
jgi:hypothetical protein